MGLLKKHPCTQYWGKPPIQLEYCEFNRDAEFVHVQKSTEMVSVRNKEGKLIHSPKDIVTLNMVPPSGAPWAKEESDAAKHFLIYNSRTNKCYPVLKEKFPQHYKKGWFSKMQTEQTTSDVRIDPEAKDEAPKASKQKPASEKPKKEKKAKKAKPKKAEPKAKKSKKQKKS